MKLSDFHGAEPPHFKLFEDGTRCKTIRCLKEEDQRAVWLIEIPGRGLTTLKRWPLTWMLRWKSLFQQAQPQRQITGAWKLLTAGINTPQPVTPLYRSGPFLQLEMPFIEGITALELLQTGAGLLKSDRFLIARELGNIVQKLAQSGLRHRDLKLENIVVKLSEDSQSPPALWLIDPVGIRSSTNVQSAIVYMLDRLAIQPIHEGIPLAQSSQIICIRAATSLIPRHQRKQFFQQLRKQLNKSTGSTRFTR